MNLKTILRKEMEQCTFPHKNYKINGTITFTVQRPYAITVKQFFSFHKKLLTMARFVKFIIMFLQLNTSHKN